MRINYDFYNGNDAYSDGEIENQIIEYAKIYKNMDEVFKNDLRWPVFYHLTPIRKNILNWYPFKEDSDVLEIGAGMGAITEVLCEKCKNVVSVELSKNRATSIATRNEDKENLDIIVGNLNDIDFKGRKFDYITLIGVLEYAPSFTKSDNPYIEFLSKIQNLLKPDGKLLIAIENKFGMKYFAGAPEDHTSVKYDGITGYKNSKGVQTFGKDEIKNILEQTELKNTKFYYPLPDYKLPSLMFSEDYLPTEKSVEKYIPYYYEGTELEFDEITAYKEIIKNNMFEFFANSFFIECSRESIDTKVDLEKAELIEISEVSKKFYEKDYSKKNYVEEINHLEKQKNELQNRLTAIEGSRMWKILKPVRSLRKKFSK